MEFQEWYDLQLSAIVAMFGKSMEELGLHSQKSQSLFGVNQEPKVEASKSLGLGDLLTFFQKHLNQILQYINPEYFFEFVGYERDDPKIKLDIMKGEVESIIAVNEKRVEVGKKSIDLTKITNPLDLPANPHILQAWQALQQGGGMGGGPFGDMGGMDGEEGFEDEDEEIENSGGEEAGDEKSGAGWDEIEGQRGAVKKSLGDAVRIVI
jgi:hypothetical protein